MSDRQEKPEIQLIALTADNYQRYLTDWQKIEQEAFALPWHWESFCNDICHHQAAYYLACIQDEHLIGYASYWLIAGEGNINNVAIAKPFRGRGLGKQLMQALIADCKQRKGTAMTLEVRESNQAAITLYESLGFHIAGVRPHYYEDNQENALIMWLYFNSEKEE